MTRRRVLAAALAALSAVAAVGATGGAAASLALTEAQKQEALRFGEQSVSRESFDAEWKVDNGAGENVTVLTPFHRLAVAARHAAFKDEALKPNETERLLREQRDRLVVWAQLRGSREDFAQRYAPELRAGDRTIKPAFVQNERTALRQESGIYLARCFYAFPVKELTGQARVSLVVRDAQGRTASTFTIDLSTMR